MAASAWNGEQRPGQLLVDAGRRGSQAVADRPARFPVRDSKAGEVEEQVGGIHLNDLNRKLLQRQQFSVRDAPPLR